jgi:hypothetical protein
MANQLNAMYTSMGSLQLCAQQLYNTATTKRESLAHLA